MNIPGAPPGVRSRRRAEILHAVPGICIRPLRPRSDCRNFLTATERGFASSAGWPSSGGGRVCHRPAAWFAFCSPASLRTCSAEDLLVHKAFAGRSRDWTDVEGILQRQGGRLDLALVRHEPGPLLELKGTPEAMDRLAALCQANGLGFPG